MAQPLRRSQHFIGVLATIINSFKTILGSANDPGHSHAGAAGANRHHERLVPVAPGTQIHAAIAAGSALNVSTAFTRIMPATNIRLSRGGAGVATNYTVTGTRFGQVISEVIASNGASDVEGVKIFDTVTSITSNVDPTVTTTVKSGVMVGLDRVAVAIEFLAVGTSDSNGVVETGTLNAGLDGFTPTTAPDGLKIFHIRYTHTLATTATATTGITVTVGGTSACHLDATEVTITLANATDLASSIALANRLKAAYNFHAIDYGVGMAHSATDTTNVCATALATDLTTCVALANALKAKYNAHRVRADIHQNADNTNAVTSPDATDLASVQTLLTEMKGDFNAHIASAVPGQSLRVQDL